MKRNTYKKGFSLIIILILCLGLALSSLALSAHNPDKDVGINAAANTGADTAPIAPAATEFSDVSTAFWAYDSIKEAFADGVMNGTSYNEATGERIFSPDDSVTYAQLFAIITRAFYSEEVAASTATGAWYAPNMEVCRNHNFLNEVLSDAPDDPASRSGMASFISNVLIQQKGVTIPDDAEIESIEASITDIWSLSLEVQKMVAVCYKYGIITGIDESHFAPAATMTRAQMAVIYTRLKDVVVALAEQAGSGTGDKTDDKTDDGTEEPTLTNGEAVTVENVLALMEEFKNGKQTELNKEYSNGYAPGSTYDPDEPRYYFKQKKSYGRECAKFAFMFSDDLFGDLPMREITDYQQIRPGDILHFPGHWTIARDVPSYNSVVNRWLIMTVSGGSDGLVAWDETGANPILNIDAAYTRYPD